MFYVVIPRFLLVVYADGNEHVLKSLLKSKDGVVIAIPAEINPVDAIAVTLQTFLHAAPSREPLIDAAKKKFHSDLQGFELIRRGILFTELAKLSEWISRF